MKYGWMMIWLVALAPALRAQEAFGFREAIDYALTHNVQVKKSENEILKARKKVWETTATGLPQVSGTVNYQRFIDKPVNMMPARIFNPQAPPDQYIPVSFGTDQNMKWSVNVNQLVFNGSYITGLYSSRVYKKISELAAVKTRQKVKEAAAQAYVNAVLADKNLEIVRANIDVVRRNLAETREMYKNGFVEDTDVRQLEITLASLENRLKYLEKMRETAYEMLNFVMGRRPDEPLVLTEDAEALARLAADFKSARAEFDPSRNIDYRIGENRVRAQKLMVRFEQSKMLPSIGAFYSYGKNAYNNDFTFFDKDQAWYEQSFVGLSLNIPLFGGLVRQKRVGQARLDYRNALLDFENLSRELQIKYKKLLSDYTLALDEWHTARKNLDLAAEIERRERIKYKEGVGNSFRLNLARMQLYQTQQQYIDAIGKLVLKKIELENFLNDEE
ncbi:MAG: TolC family protein [Chlorobi bacterium]|nr:TolC family protein [Chlorobiota bacterium]